MEHGLCVNRMRDDIASMADPVLMVEFLDLMAEGNPDGDGC